MPLDPYWRNQVVPVHPVCNFEAMEVTESNGRQVVAWVNHCLPLDGVERRAEMGDKWPWLLVGGRFVAVLEGNVIVHLGGATFDVYSVNQFHLQFVACGGEKDPFHPDEG